MRKLSTALSTVAVLALMGGANASPFTVFPFVGGGPLSPPYVNFDNLAAGNAGGTSGGLAVSFGGDGQVIAGGSSTQWAAPYLSNNNGSLFGDPTNGPDTTKYLTSGLGSVTIVFPQPEKYLGLLWGSVDLYNTLSFYDGSTLIGSITGGDVMPGANGDRGINGTLYVNILSSLAFDSIVATSSQYAFEFDNVSYNSTGNIQPPEPLTLSLFSAGLLGLARLRRRHRR